MIALVILKILVSNEVDESPIRTVIAVPGKTNAEICNTIRAKPRKKKDFLRDTKKTVLNLTDFFRRIVKAEKAPANF